MMFITRALLGAATIWGVASAVPGTPTQTPEPVALKSDQVFVTACADSLGDGPTEMGLFELRGQRNGRNYYAHVMDGMGTEIWFGQPARAPGQLVFDFDDNGPRTGPRWLIGHGPERTYYQAFADNDDPRPPSTGWAALFSSIITAPCLVFPPGPVPFTGLMLPILKARWGSDHHCRCIERTISEFRGRGDSLRPPQRCRILDPTRGTLQPIWPHQSVHNLSIPR